MKKVAVLLIFILTSNIALATPAMCSMSATGGLLDTFLQSYYEASQSWLTTLAPIAIKMFWFWFTCEFLWQLTFKKILTNDIHKLYIFFVIRIFTAYFFAQCFVNPDFYMGIIEYFTNLGAQTGGFSVTPDSGNPFGTLSPSGIINIGLCSWNSLFAFLGSNVGWTSMLNAMIYALPMVFMTLLITMVAIIMALALVMLALESYIVLFGGFILCGFAGSGWTQSYWQKYLSYVGGIAIRFFVMCLILSIMQSQLNTLFTSIVSASSGTDYVKLIGVFFNTLICMVINAFIVLKVPAMAASMLSGQVSGGLGDFIQGASMVMSGASMVKAFGTSKAVSNLAQSALTSNPASAIATSALSSSAIKAATDIGSKAASMSNSTRNQSANSSQPGASSKSTSSPLFGNDNPGSSSTTDSNGIMGKNDTGNVSNKANSINEAKRHLGKMAEQAGRISGNAHAGSSELNISPHRE